MAHNTMRHQALDDLMDPPNGWWRTGVEILQGLQLLFERKSSGGLGRRWPLKKRIEKSILPSYYGCFIVYYSFKFQPLE